MAALAIGSGDEVIVPDVTFGATASAVLEEDRISLGIRLLAGTCALKE
jgi:dTDP-4-amino-4,6-dideoxygalactose transaminase